jgi:hypothetical protein
MTKVGEAHNPRQYHLPQILQNLLAYGSMKTVVEPMCGFIGIKQDIGQ